jgi:hypothetical protein
MTQNENIKRRDVRIVNRYSRGEEKKERQRERNILEETARRMTDRETNRQYGEEHRGTDTERGEREKG